MDPRHARLAAPETVAPDSVTQADPGAERWLRVARFRPRLRDHAQIVRQHLRGELWYVLDDRASGRQHRLNPVTYQIVALMDGQRTLQELFGLARERFGDDAPNQDDLLRLLAQLHAADVIAGDVPPDLGELAHRSGLIASRRRIQRWRNPLALRFPLFDPERMLHYLAPLVRLIFSRAGLLLWVLVVGFGALEASRHWPELTADFTDRVLAAQNLLLLWLTFPLIKAVHEFAHAAACSRFGGEVHEMGLMLLVFTPIPYVDASASGAFPSRWQRALVGAAGMLAELFVAAIALFVWLGIESGPLRGVLYNVMLIASITTVLFNANPLLRFDGYYILSDLVEIPNLAARGTRHWMHLIQRHILGLPMPAPTASAGERAWFRIFTPLSTVYRVVVVVGIALFIAQRFFFLGVMLALFALASILVWPLWRGVRFLLTSDALRLRRRRALGGAGVAAAGVALLLGVLPVPLATLSEGVVWYPEESQVNAGVAGEALEVLVKSGTQVAVGTPLLRLENPAVMKRAAALAARATEIERRRQVMRTRDLVQAQIAMEEYQQVAAELAAARKDVAALTVRSPAEGVYLLPGATDVPGRFVQRGEVLGFVLADAGVRVRAVIAQQDAALVRSRLRGVGVRLAARPDAAHVAELLREVPAASRNLPSIALTTEGGGGIAVDPRAKETPQALLKYFQVELLLPTQPAQALPVGMRAYVRFDHGYEPLAAQAYRRVRQVFLERLGT